MRARFRAMNCAQDAVNVVPTNVVNALSVQEEYMFDVSKIGHSFPPFTVVVERAKIRELALAIGDTNPIYHSQQAAQIEGYTDIPLSPTMATSFLFWANTHFVENLIELGLDAPRLMHREEDYEYMGSIQVGETLTGVMTVIDGSSRKARNTTTIDLVTLQLRYTNEQQKPVLIATTRLASRE